MQTIAYNINTIYNRRVITKTVGCGYRMRTASNYEIGGRAVRYKIIKKGRCL